MMVPAPTNSKRAISFYRVMDKVPDKVDAIRYTLDGRFHRDGFRRITFAYMRVVVALKLIC